ncbi:MAG: hypothetical protein PHQ81_10130 [Methanofollis sp.]|nr:hypothetical protein [Methanofollis sp.]
MDSPSYLFGWGLCPQTSRDKDWSGKAQSITMKRGLLSPVYLRAGGFGGRHAPQWRIAFRISGRKHFGSRGCSPQDSFGICSMKMIQTFNSGVMDENSKIQITLITDMRRIKLSSK